MFTFEQSLEEALAEQRAKNIEEAQRMYAGPLDDEMRRKLATLAATLQCPVAYALYLVKTDPEWAAAVAKDPKKQNLNERLLPPYLENFGIEAKKLPVDKKNALYLINGIVIKGYQSDRIDVKSIDFTWSKGGMTAYMAHKYTTGDGGAQNSQAEELLRFAEQARQFCGTAPTMFYVGADGDHFALRRKYEGDQRDTFYEYVNRRYGARHVFAGRLDQIAEHWNAIAFN